MSFIPFVVTWCFLAGTVLVLGLYRNLAAMHEDDLVHLGAGEEKLIPGQVTFFRKLERVERWGKTLTVVTLIGGLLLGAAVLYCAW
jgi:hypothetical protein